MRYFFHLVSGRGAYSDKRGGECPDPAGALTEAQTKLRANQGLGRRWSVCALPIAPEPSGP
jgi:hypothetical protein